VATFTNDITGNRTVTIDTTSRTVGALSIGDSSNSHYFTLTASGGASLIFDNGGSGATLTETGALSGTNSDRITTNITLADNLTVNAAGYIQLTGTISGVNRSITKTGAGSLLLSGNNSFSGGVTLSTGTLLAASNTAFGAGTLTIDGGRLDIGDAQRGVTITTTNANVWNANWIMGRSGTGVANWNNNGTILLGNNVAVTSANAYTNLNLGNVISDNGNNRSFSTGASLTTLSGANTYTGGTNVTAGIAHFTKTNAMPATGTVAMSTNTTLTVSAGGAGEFTNATSGAGSIGGLLAASAIGGQSAPVTWAGTARLGIDTTNATGGSLTYSGVIANRGTSMGILKQGTGNLVLDQANTYTGVTTVTQGNLVAGSDSLSGQAGAFGNATSEIALGVAAGVNVGGVGADADAGILIGGAFNIGRIIRLATANNSDAGTRVLTLGGNTAHNSEFSGNIFLGTTNQAGRGVTLTAASGGQVTFSGVIQNPTSMDATNYTVTKAGLGTVVLSNANTYTGNTTVNEGTLLINGSTSSTSLVTVNNGGTLGGTGTIGGSVTLNDGATLSPGASIESLATGSNVWNGGSTIVFEFSTDGSNGTAGAQWDLLTITGTLGFGDASDTNRINFDLVTMLNATTAGLLGTWDPDADATWAGFVTTTGGITNFAANLFNIDTTGFQNTINGSFSIVQDGNNLNLVYTAIPEPRAALLGGLGLLALLRRRRA
jgi:fibronectin-binding autotransporter adhesin